MGIDGPDSSGPGYGKGRARPTGPAAGERRDGRARPRASGDTRRVASAKVVGPKSPCACDACDGKLEWPAERLPPSSSGALAGACRAGGSGADAGVGRDAPW